MQDSLITSLDNAAELEKLYRKNKTEFRQDFNLIYSEYKDRPLVQFWHERLNYESSEISWGSGKQLKFVLLISILAGILAKLPDIFSLEEDFYYPRNISFLVFPFLSLLFAWKKKLSHIKFLVSLGLLLVSLVYINILPNDPDSDTLMLACIHLPLILWVIFGISYTSPGFRDKKNWLNFLSFNGELLVLSAMLVLAGIILTGITIGLFDLIGLDIVEFYFRYLVIFTLPAVPILACHLIQINPNLVNKISPIIAKIFSPLVLIMLVTYLAAIVLSGKDPYTDRDFLILFNILLLGVMALIFFSIAEGSREDRFGFNKYILLPLALVTTIINLIALSAIIFRISEWGFTPNRLAVLGGNILILIHLLIVAFRLFRVVIQEENVLKLGQAMVIYLPVYLVWTLVVVFLFPLLFNFQ